jgi:hypothetical protein
LPPRKTRDAGITSGVADSVVAGVGADSVVADSVPEPDSLLQAASKERKTTRTNRTPNFEIDTLDIESPHGLDWGIR